jgi:hypothetical protein
MTDQFVIWSVARQAYCLARGYTAVEAEAARFTLEAAVELTRHCREAVEIRRAREAE